MGRLSLCLSVCRARAPDGRRESAAACINKRLVYSRGAKFAAAAISVSSSFAFGLFAGRSELRAPAKVNVGRPAAAAASSLPARQVVCVSLSSAASGRASWRAPPSEAA